MNNKLNKAIRKMIQSIIDILNDNVLSIYIYGSCVLGDFKLGWSDIDVLVLTKNDLSQDDANKLLSLRQDLLLDEPDNRYFRSFEGAILSKDGFLKGREGNVVYWGTKGEKIKNSYSLDSFSMKELKESGRLIYGEEVRHEFAIPTYQDLKDDIIHHYNTIREHAQTTGRNLYSFGWFLDISRCIYTLTTGKIISKTDAGQWALKNDICPNKNIMQTILKIRNNPLKYKKRQQIMDWAETLGCHVQEYADVLENYINAVETKKDL